MNETEKFTALYDLFADYFVEQEKPLTEGQAYALEAKVRHLLSIPHTRDPGPPTRFIRLTTSTASAPPTARAEASLSTKSADSDHLVVSAAAT